MLEDAFIVIEDNLAVLYAIGGVLIFVVGVASALEAIIKTRTAQGAVAWAILLVVFPPLIVPLYWVFGRRRFHGYAKARRQGNLNIQHLAAELNREFLQHVPVENHLPDAVRTLETLVHMPFTAGNHVDLLVNGGPTFEQIFAHIEKAKHYVLLEFYIVRDDNLGEKLKALLLQKAAEGVPVYFIYDEIGSFHLGRDYVRGMLDGGVLMRPFNSTKGIRNRFQLNFRNHRKLVVVDGECALIGGSNVGDEYVDKHPYLTPWRDTNIAIRGPAVQAIQLAFVEDWYWATESVPKLRWDIRNAEDGNVDTLVVPSGPADNLETCALLFIDMIHHARKRLWIVSPYFVPDAAVVAALQLAALRGVDVRILLPGRADNLLVQLSSYTYVMETIFCGIRFYRYERGFLHQKVMLVDDEYATVGTANLDNRSFRLNFELIVLMRSRTFAAQVEAMLESDFSVSRRLHIDEVQNWSGARKLLSRCAYLFAPIQ